MVSENIQRETLGQPWALGKGSQAGSNPRLPSQCCGLGPAPPSPNLPLVCKFSTVAAPSSWALQKILGKSLCRQVKVCSLWGGEGCGVAAGGPGWMHLIGGLLGGVEARPGC